MFIPTGKAVFCDNLDENSQINTDEQWMSIDGWAFIHTMCKKLHCSSLFLKYKVDIFDPHCNTDHRKTCTDIMCW